MNNSIDNSKSFPVTRRFEFPLTSTIFRMPVISSEVHVRTFARARSRFSHTVQWFTRRHSSSHGNVRSSANFRVRVQAESEGEGYPVVQEHALRAFRQDCQGDPWHCRFAKALRARVRGRRRHYTVYRHLHTHGHWQQLSVYYDVETIYHCQSARSRACARELRGCAAGHRAPLARDRRVS